YGDSFAHAATGAVHANFVMDQTMYLAVFGMLAVAGAASARRLVGLRIAEAARAAREEERTLMVAGLAHELRNPLASLHGAAQLLGERGGGDARLAGMVLADAARLNGVLEGFLRDARPFPLAPRAADLAALARGFCAEQSRLRPDAPVECRVHAAPVVAFTDPDAIRQILLNLVRNARQYQPAGRPARLGLAVSGGGAEFRVEDDGPGVPEAERSRLFEPYRSTSATGAGIGLAVSRRIARELGGDLWHEPLDPGARFVLAVGGTPGGDA